MRTMTGQPEQPTVDLSRRRLLSVAALTVLGIVLFGIAITTTEADWMVWALGLVMIGSSIAFWTAYGLYRHRQRTARRDTE